jgi:hypothetical protein
MVRRKRRDKINEYHLGEIDRALCKLRRAADAATLRLTPFKPHYDAIVDLHDQARRTLNILNDRDPEYVAPHNAPMSRR